MTDNKVKLSTSSFRDTPLVELCMEDALALGKARLKGMNPEDFRDTSIRFCIDGLYDWLTIYVDKYCNGSLFKTISALSWHWESFCDTDATLLKLRAGFSETRHEIAENTSYVDLMDSLHQGPRHKEFGYVSRHPTLIRVPSSVVRVVGHTSSALGMSFSRFFQVGLAWSLSTNREGLYSAWVTAVFTPLFTSLMDYAKQRLNTLEEVRILLEDRRKKS